MTNWQIEYNENVYDYIENPQVHVGDTIEIMSDNQLGYKKYKVILGKNGNKDLRTIADWSLDIFEEDNNEQDNNEENGMTDDEQDGGKKTRKHKSKRTRRGNIRKNKKNRKTRKTRKNRSRRH